MALDPQAQAVLDQLAAVGLPEFTSLEVTGKRYDGVIHGFFTMSGAIDAGKAAVSEAGRAL